MADLRVKPTRSCASFLIALLVIVVAMSLPGCGRAAGQSADAVSDVGLPPGVTWGPNPALPPGGQLAVVAGTPQAQGLYAIRVGFSPDLRVMPHSHPEHRIYTVLGGTWWIGLGETFDEEQLEAHAPGATYVVPAGTAHFHWARSGASVVQITGVGPTSTDYVNPREDPRAR